MTLSNASSVLPVKKTASLYSLSVSTNVGGVNHAVVDLDQESTQDQYDIACDARYLYITWEALDGATKNVYLTALSLQTGAVAPGFPKFVGSGMRPTVAADVRAEYSSPNCDVAFINPTGTAIEWGSCVNGTLTVVGMTTMMQHPGFSDEQYTHAYHARVLVGSVYGVSASPYGPRAIYAIVDKVLNPGYGHLVLFRDLPATPVAALYVDGAWAGFSHPVPVDGTFPVQDKPLVAVANPYDGEGLTPPSTPGATPFNEYHCLYQLVRTYYDGTSNVTHYPLMIVRVSDAGTSESSNTEISRPAGSSFTIQRPDIDHAFGPDAIDGYAAGVNQMGIHVHYQDATNFFYIRDQRSFDEPIEENTLASYTTIVRDGADHQSVIPNSPTRQVGSGLRFVLWAEPIDGSFTATPGGSHDPILQFSGPNARLEIGPATTEGEQSGMVAFPTFLVQFIDATQGIDFLPNSLFDYYGNSVAGAEEHFTFAGAGTTSPSLNFTGSGVTLSDPSFGFPTTITNPATINIRGGATLTTTSAIQLTADGAVANLWFEPTVQSATPADAMDVCKGSQSFSNSIISCQTSGSHAGSGVWEAIRIRPSVLPKATKQFSLVNSVCNRADREMIIEGENDPSSPSTPYRYFFIEGGKMNGTSIRLADAVDYVTISHVIFDNLLGDFNWSYGSSTSGPFAVQLDRPNPTTFQTYRETAISDNDFRIWSTTGADNISVVYIGDYALILPPPYLYGSGIALGIDRNTFNTSGSEGAGTLYSAINLYRSVANVRQNAISGAKYNLGIDVNGDDRAVNPGVCTNEISYCSYAGIRTINLSAYMLSNTISNVDGYGHISWQGDNPKLVGSDYQNNGRSGLYVLGNNCTPDLSGILHPNGVGDIAGYNDIEGNDPTTGYQIEFATNDNNYSSITLGGLHAASSNYALNRVVGTWDVKGPSVPNVIDIGDVSNNYWGGAGVATDVTFSNDLPVNSDPINDRPNFPCLGNGAGTRQKAHQSVLSVPDTTCQAAYNQGYLLLSNNQPAAARDTLEHWVEQCYMESYSWQAFAQISHAVSQLQGSDARYWDYRQWLFSVLYLKPDTVYYCEDASALITTFAYMTGPRGIDNMGEAAVLTYLLESGKCPGYTKYFETVLKNRRTESYHRWRDSVTDSLVTPYDTTLPTLKEIGFEALLGPGAYVPIAELPKTVLRSIRVLPSITRRDAEVELTMNLPATVTLELYDGLGTARGRLLEDTHTTRGVHHIPLNLNGLPVGTYYVRAEIPEGEVQTVRFVKQ